MKFRVMQSDIFVDMMTALGANATPMPYGEVYSAHPDRRDRRCREQLAVVRILGPLRSCGLLHAGRAPDRAGSAGDVQGILGQAVAEDQAAVRQAARDSVPVMREMWVAREKASEEKVRAAGVEVITEIDKEPFMAAMDSVYEKHVTSDKLKDLVARIRSTD
jgi:TRAP-type C4-dicarboxylate transport system substrate-binding protein